MVARRVAGEPLEVILGWAEFCGLRVRVAEGVFVPRRRTGFVVETALGGAALCADDSRAAVLDLCCGSGAVGAAVEAARPGARVFAADLDPRAVAVARLNLRDPARVFESDLFAALPPALQGHLDVILANAPYVPSDELEFLPQEARLHEPRSALDGGATGTELHERIAGEATHWLSPGGELVIETSERQAHRTAGHLASAGFETSIRHSADLDATVVVGVGRP